MRSAFNHVDLTLKRSLALTGRLPGKYSLNTDVLINSRHIIIKTSPAIFDIPD